VIDARVIGANDASMSSCSKPAVLLVTVDPGLWLELGPGGYLSGFPEMQTRKMVCYDILI